MSQNLETHLSCMKLYVKAAKMSETQVHEQESDVSRDTEAESAESNSESSESAQRYLDVVAVETDDNSSEDSSEEESSDEEGSQGATLRQFRPFSRLPPELRNLIWEDFCPDLTAPSRIVDFYVSPGSGRHQLYASEATKKSWTIKPGMFLYQQTLALRTVLSVHKESRANALRVVPDTVAMDAGHGDALVRFNKDHDVAMVDGIDDSRSSITVHLPDFGDEVKNLALHSRGGDFGNLDRETVSRFLSQFSHLETLLVCTAARSHSMEHLTWSTSRLIHHYTMQNTELRPGFGEDITVLYCWPDLINHGDFARFQIPPLVAVPERIGRRLEEIGARAWPIVCFEFQSGLDRYKALCNGELDSGDDDSLGSLPDDSEDSHTDLDEYESEGIDDEEIVQTYDSSEDEDDIDDQVPIQTDSPRPDYLQAQFSSPEPDSGPEAAHGNDGAVMALRRKRRIISDSDGEDEEDLEPVAKRARTTVVISSDSESTPTVSEASPQVHEPRRKARIVLSDSDSDDAKEPEKNSPGSESEDSAASDDDDDDEPAVKPVQRISLADRLRQHREDNPVESVASSEYNSEPGPDYSSIAADIEEGDDEEDESGEEGGAFLRMAEESNGEEDQDDDDDDDEY